MNTKKNISIILMLAILMLSIGCSSKTDTSESIQPTLLSFKSADINMAEDFSDIICTDSRSGRFLIFGKLKTDEYSGYITDNQFKDKQYFTFTPSENETVRTAALMKYGNTAVLSVSEDDTVIYTYNNECVLRNTFNIGDVLTEDDLYTSMICDENGFYIDIDHQRLVYIDKDGNYQGEIDTNGKDICGLSNDADGAPCILLSSNVDTYLCKLSGGTITDEVSCGELASYVNSICPGCEKYTVSAVAAGGLYALNNNKWEKITDFSDNDFSTQYIHEVEMVSEEEFVILLNSDGQGVKLRLLTQRDISEIQQKKIIQIALTYGGNTDPYTNLIKKYNSDSEKYRVEFVDYYNANPEEEYDQLRLDIISGKAPDIILFNDYYPVSSFGDEESIFVDFYDLIDNDSEISRDDFLDGFLETMETKGKLLQLNPAFIIETNMIKTKYTSGLTSWNPKVFPDVVNNIPKGMAFSLESQLLDKTEMFFKLVDHYQFISEDKSKCNYDSEEFIELLKEIKELDIGISDGTYKGGVELGVDTMISSFRNDEALTLNEHIRCFYDYKLCEQVYSGEDLTFIGYMNDNEINARSHPLQTFGIMANSDNIEGAWDFLKFYMFQKESLHEPHFYGIPGMRRIFDELIHDQTIEEYNYFAPGSATPDTFELQPFTDEEAEEIESFILNALKNSYQADHTIDSIVREEIGAYFAGEKSAEQTAEYIQNRVEIYLSEIY